MREVGASLGTGRHAVCPAVGRLARSKWLHVIMGSDIALACEAVASCFIAVLECIWGGSGGWIRGGSGVIRGDQGGSEQEMAYAAAEETYETHSS